MWLINAIFQQLINFIQELTKLFLVLNQEILLKSEIVELVDSLLEFWNDVGVRKCR